MLRRLTRAVSLRHHPKAVHAVHRSGLVVHLVHCGFLVIALHDIEGTVAVIAAVFVVLDHLFEGIEE